MANPTTPPENTTMASTTTSLVDITKIIEQFKLPGVDMSALITARQKDIEALTQVNRIAYESLQAMAQKQTEILKTTMEELQSAAQKMAAKPMESITHESQLVQQTLQKAFGYMHELAELTRKSQAEALDVINKRVKQNVEELKGLVQSRK
jgi:phasin family protein